MDYKASPDSCSTRNGVVSAGFNQFGQRLSKLNLQRREGSFHVGEEEGEEKGEEKDDMESDDGILSEEEKQRWRFCLMEYYETRQRDNGDEV